MAKRKLPKDVDLTRKINPADGFFSTPVSDKKDQENKTEENIVSQGDSTVPDNGKKEGGKP